MKRVLGPFREACKQRHGGAADAVAVPEPVDEWTAVAGNREHNVLAAFYGDKTRWASTFQGHVLVTRVKAVNEAVVAWCMGREKEGDMRHATDPAFTLYVLCERSTHTDKHVFVQALRREGAMSPLECAVYESMWEFWNERLFPGTACCVVFIETPADVCGKQLASRSRAEEQGDGAVPRQYLLALEELHENALAKASNWAGAPRVTVPHGPFHTDRRFARSIALRVAEVACVPIY